MQRSTQKAAWTIGTNATPSANRTVFEAGIYNLTEDVSPMLVHFSKDHQRSWLLVRLAQ